MNSSNSQGKIVWGAFIAGLVIIVLGGIFLYTQKVHAPENESGEYAKTPAPVAAQPPVLRPEPPKLAGHILIGPKVTTKFYLAKDGKRYVFPEETKTFETWFPNAAKAPITKVSQDELESYPLGGNVWYRPGTRLIHIGTDTHIYAVAHGGVLRAINEGNAALLFGADWNKLLDLMPDYYFTNYTIGAPILAPAQYSVAIEQGLSQTIDMDKGVDY